MNATEALNAIRDILSQHDSALPPVQPVPAAGHADTPPGPDGTYRLVEANGSLLEQYFAPSTEGAERVYFFNALRQMHTIAISAEPGGVGFFQGAQAWLYFADGTLYKDVVFAGPSSGMQVDMVPGALYSLKVKLVAGGCVVVQVAG